VVLVTVSVGVRKLEIKIMIKCRNTDF